MNDIKTADKSQPVIPNVRPASAETKMTEITLRDYLAASVLTAIAGMYVANVDHASVLAYKFADAMLRQRELK